VISATFIGDQSARLAAAWWWKGRKSALTVGSKKINKAGALRISTKIFKIVAVRINARTNNAPRLNGRGY
jgi:hypothetical protein